LKEFTMRKIVLALSAVTLTVPALPASTAFAHSTGSYHQHCRKPNGTPGLLVGGAAGALVGREIDKHGSRATGTILGAAVGALAGRHVQRNVISRRCR
jgi:uncharacterized protein YcfJ